MKAVRCWVAGSMIGIGLLNAGCSDGESTRPKELTTAQDQGFKATYDASREVEGKNREP